MVVVVIVVIESSNMRRRNGWEVVLTASIYLVSTFLCFSCVD